jgi:hypothetical protein
MKSNASIFINHHKVTTKMDFVVSRGYFCFEWYFIRPYPLYGSFFVYLMTLSVMSSNGRMIKTL